MDGRPVRIRPDRAVSCHVMRPLVSYSLSGQQPRKNFMIPFWIQMNGIHLIEMMPLFAGIFAVFLATSTSLGGHS